MKLLLINNYLQKFDLLRNNPVKNINELGELKDEINSIICSYIKKYNKEDVFTDILNHIELDINDEMEKAYEKMEHNQGVHL